MNQKAEPSMACLSDSAPEQMLVFAAKNGDEQAFEMLFQRYQQKVLRVVLRYAHVREDAEDIVQQSFQKAFLHLCRFEGKSSFSTWLTRIAINEALMFLRSIGAMRKIPIDDLGGAVGSATSLELADSRQDTEASYLHRERVGVLLSALKNLTPRMRQAVELRDLAELSTEQTAQRMGLSVGAVKARLFHARKSLRERLRRYLKANRSGTNALDMDHSSEHVSQNRLCNESGS